MIEELKSVIQNNEKILYEGKPDKKCFIFESIFNPLLPFAILWALFDFGIIGNTILTEERGKILYFLIPFMLIHLMPVWLYVGGVFFSSKRYKNTAYIITDKAIYISKGIFAKNIVTKPFAELSHINLHRGIFDQMFNQMFNVGDIIATSSQLTTNGTSTTLVIESISNYVEIYNLVKKLQTDIYADIMYPNDKRPLENHGYNTEYKK